TAGAEIGQIADRTYHWQIGRETTAAAADGGGGRRTYHWQIGRETTARSVSRRGRRRAVPLRLLRVRRNAAHSGWRAGRRRRCGRGGPGPCGAGGLRPGGR